ncbi:MAG: hypothetical protein ABL886_15340, partial [Rhodoglobus sp.]
PLASTTGVRVPDDGAVWRDRASLIEESWRDVVPSLTDPFDSEPHAPTGLVAFNSVDLLTGCRVAVSQVVLNGAGPPAITGDERVDCKLDTDEPPLTIDLLAAFPEECPWNADWATTAMNSARFPVVTPAGGIDRAKTDECTEVHVQLVDGGYAENTALGLQADVAPELSQIVRAYNASLGAGEHLVVPYLLYIQNSPDGYVEEPPRQNTPQLIVPIVGNGTKAEQLTPSTWIQRIMSAYAQVCETSIETEGPCAGLTEGSLVTKRRTVVAAVNTEVAVSVPLGWGLSETTATRLLQDARAQAAACPASARDYPCLASLLTGLTSEG